MANGQFALTDVPFLPAKTCPPATCRAAFTTIPAWRCTLTSPAVESELSYLAPESTVLRRFTVPGHSVNTGTYDKHVMPIRNARLAETPFSLDRNGFVLAQHRSAVADFTDREEVDRVYVAEVDEFLKSSLGADRVVTMSWMLRRSVDPAENSSQPVGALVHDDYSVIGGRRAAESMYQARFPDGPGYRRAIITSVWRVFSPPPQDWPLALCDYTSVKSEEGLDNRLYCIGEMPDDLYAEMPETTPGANGFEFHHNPGHQWWYFPDMTRDEILFFKLNDSDQSVAWRVPHTAFRDNTAQATAPRHSIECRSISYFE
ncbi:CmcJ/NvfI family oxidoreductase [Amycolatopsis pithecellobii]|uniref:Methyltransferase n=1 Tax=Amycolatopsis pithecellobii TaxID=664692 RepID=A0A6N7ZC47_9PSEU|nr:CmcJ/NvfI family oxidoreductase [Amycolatopsis pithecellobii]MTD59320.1 hypothetical protein [Amycolatopsis pithecellobii]